MKPDDDQRQDDVEQDDRVLEAGRQHRKVEAHTQSAPSAACPVVSVPIGGPMMIVPVSTRSMLPPPDDLERETGRAHGGRAPPRFSPPHPVVLRAVAGALEPLRGLTPGHPAAEVDAALVQGDVAELHAGEDQRACTPTFLAAFSSPHPSGYGLDVRLRRHVVDRASSSAIAASMSVDVADGDVAAEPARARRRRPQEPEHRRADTRRRPSGHASRGSPG